MTDSENQPGVQWVPVYRQQWLLIVLLLTISFLALVPLASGQIYRKQAGAGLWVPIKRSTKIIYFVLSFWLTAAILFHYVGPDDHTPKEASTASSNVSSSSSANSAADTPQPTAPAACDDSDAIDAVKGAIEDSPASKLVTIKVVDFGNAHELYFDKKSNVRFCEANALLNSGSTKISYRIFFGPSGDQAVEEQEGADAYNTAGMKITAAAVQPPASSAAPSSDSDIEPKPGTVYYQSSQAGETACKATSISQDMLYSKARTAILDEGFQPTPPPRDEYSYCSDSANADVCRERPEIEACSADGYCKMDFTDGSGNTLSVSTFGDGPDPTVTGFSIVCK
jgi:hypothetical protein